MVIDKISNFHLYLKENIYSAISDFLSGDLASLEDGRYELGNGIYAKLSASALHKEGRFETHRKYADVQILLSEGEDMEWIDADALENPTEYHSEKDVTHYERAAEEAVRFHVKAG